MYTDKAATYKTMVRPVIEYASVVWDPNSEGDSVEQLAMSTATTLIGPRDVSQKC